MKMLMNAGVPLKEIFTLDAYEVMLILGSAMFDNDIGEEGQNG